VHQQPAGGVERDEALDGPVLRRTGDKMAEIFRGELAHEPARLGGDFVEVFFVGREQGGAFGPIFGDDLGRRGGPRLGQVHRFAAAREDAVERIIIRGGDRVELVIVAPRAREGEVHDPAADGVDAVVDDQLGRLEVTLETAADGEEAQRAQVGFIGRRQAVGGDLFEHETVERTVGVEGLDDVVPVGVREGNAALAVGGFFRRIGVPGDIEPVATPTLTVLGARQQLVDERREGGRTGIGGELLHALVRRRQAEQREVGAADQRARISRRIGGKLFLRQSGADKLVDGIVGRDPRGKFRRGGRGDRLESPVRLRLLQRHCDVFGIGLGRFGEPWIRRTPANPLGEHGDFCRGQLLLWRHLQVLVPVADRLDQPAGLGFSRRDHGAVIAAGLPARARVETEAAFLLLAAVTFITALDEQRPDLGFEKRKVVPAGGCGRGGRLGLGAGRSDHESSRRGDDDLTYHRGARREHAPASKEKKKHAGPREYSGAQGASEITQPRRAHR
jgi:hypothetical protein